MSYYQNALNRFLSEKPINPIEDFFKMSRYMLEELDKMRQSPGLKNKLRIKIVNSKTQDELKNNCYAYYNQYWRDEEIIHLEKVLMNSLRMEETWKKNNFEEVSEEDKEKSLDMLYFEKD